MMRILESLAIVAVVAIAVVLPPPARAHAFLERAVPAVGSVVHLPPAEVRLWFTQKLEPAFSSVRVLDRSGSPVNRGEARVDDSDPRLLRVSLPALAPGTYRVTWRVLSVDAHVTEGDFTFDIAP
jgi:methionine-rich copper-binding protein CopC